MCNKQKFFVIIQQKVDVTYD